MKLLTLLVLVLLVACQPRPVAPTTLLTQAAEQFKADCTTLCAQEQGAVTRAITLPEGTKMYTTSESICLVRNKMLFCARCLCDVEPGTAYTAMQETNLTCTLQKDTQLHVACT